MADKKKGKKRQNTRKLGQNEAIQMKTKNKQTKLSPLQIKCTHSANQETKAKL